MKTVDDEIGQLSGSCSKDAEGKLRESETFINKVIDESPFAMWIADANGTVVRTNKSLQSFLNLSDEQISGKYNVLADENLAEQGKMEDVKAVFEKFLSVRFVMPWSSSKAGDVNFKGGRDLWIDVSMFPVIGEDGRLKNVVCQWLDITEHKQAEKKLTNYAKQLEISKGDLEELTKNLEEKVEERTRDLLLAQDSLVRSEKLAVIGKMAGIVAHELRSPLTTIRNSIYFIKGKTPPDRGEKVLRHLKLMSDEIEIANGIINDILTFSRIKAHNIKKTNIKELIEVALEKIKVPQGIDLSIDIDCDIPGPMADEMQLERVFINVIRNAVEAMPVGGGLAIRVKREGDEIAFIFTDTGVGMSEDDKQHLFEPLFTTKHKGFGFGLPFCQHVVGLHGGTITFESEQNVKTTVTIRLPITPLVDV